MASNLQEGIEIAEIKGAYENLIASNHEVIQGFRNFPIDNMLGSGSPISWQDMEA